jgi:hypothetical protein
MESGEGYVGVCKGKGWNGMEWDGMCEASRSVTSPIVHSTRRSSDLQRQWYALGRVYWTLMCRTGSDCRSWCIGPSVDGVVRVFFSV